MTTDWVRRFRQFSLDVDVIEDDVFESIEATVEKYLTHVVGCHYFRVLIDGGWSESDEGETVPALRTTWCNDPAKKSSMVPIHLPSVTKRQSVFSYTTRKPLWIVGKDGMPLAETRGVPDAARDM